MAKDYYETLGISKESSKDDIKKAYKKLAKKYHPDLNKDDPKADGKFKEINEAFSVLSDEKSKSQYDRYGTVGDDYGNSGSSGFGEGFSGGFNGFEDIFDSIFGGGSGFGNFSRKSRQPRQAVGESLEIDYEISMEDVISGVKKDFTYKHYDECDNCHGSGADTKDDVKTCDVCHGSGQETVQRRTPFGVFQSTGVCHKCGGSGKIITKLCHKCDGEGRVLKKEDIAVNIPKGFFNAKLRYSGKGNYPRSKGIAGDLYINVRLKKHADYKKEGIDLYKKVPILFTKFILGGNVEVNTLHGKKEIKIKSGMPFDATFRIKDAGLIDMNSRTGDLYVNFDIQNPKLSSKFNKYIEEIDKKLS